MKEQLILAYYSNRPMKNSEVFKNDIRVKFKVTDNNLITDLYRKIINYQIKKYGLSLYNYKKDILCYERRKKELRNRMK